MGGFILIRNYFLGRLAHNFVFIQELCDEYRDGYNGLVHVYTNNPKINEEVKDYGCLSVFPLEKLPEDRRNMSMSKAMLRFVTP